MIGRAVAWVAAGLGGWFGYQLLLQNGRLLVRVEKLEEELAKLTGDAVDAGKGLPAGSVVFDFELPRLGGGTVTLSQWQGSTVLLIFFDPNCTFCRRMLPDVARLEQEPADGRPVPLLISTGSAEENHQLMVQHGLRCAVLLQDDFEVARLYQVDATPMGYLIDGRGRTASGLATGARAILALAGPSPAAGTADNGQAALPPASGNQVQRLDGALAASRINRTGLKAGTPAAKFRLPRVNGGELALDDFLGRRLLLVFSDPLCGPCQDLAPKLEELHRRSTELKVVMISRREPDVNTAAIAEHGLTFPVVLQRHWEVSRDYATFATPVGYLINERGVIAADVAMGTEAILALASAPVAG